jgi:2-oxoglutarate ferredoxin oxidoreductase subunit gamma
MAAAMVLVAAHARITGLVGLDALVAGMRESVPPYRRQHLEANERALRAGFAHAARDAAPAWSASEAA